MSNNKETLANNSHIVYDPSVNYSSSSSPLSDIAWGRVTLAFAGAVVGTWTLLKVSKIAFNGVAEMLKAGRKNGSLQTAKDLVRPSIVKHASAKNTDSRSLLKKMC